MMIRDAEFFAKCYFILRRFPVGEEFYETAYRKNSTKSIQEQVDDYCIQLMKNKTVMERIEKDINENMVPTNMRHILR